MQHGQTIVVQLPCLYDVLYRCVYSRVTHSFSPQLHLDDCISIADCLLYILESKRAKFRSDLFTLLLLTTSDTPTLPVTAKRQAVATVVLIG